MDVILTVPDPESVFPRRINSRGDISIGTDPHGSVSGTLVKTYQLKNEYGSKTLARRHPFTVNTQNDPFVFQTRGDKWDGPGCTEFYIHSNQHEARKFYYHAQHLKMD